MKAPADSPTERPLLEALLSQKELTLESLMNSVSRFIGKPIRVERIGDEQWEKLTGLLVDTPGLARILVRATDPLIYQMHCILHEVGHLLHRHASCHAIGLLEPARSHAGEFAIVRGRLIESEPGASDAAALEEHEAERTAHLLAQALLAPLDARAERTFG